MYVVPDCVNGYADKFNKSVTEYRGGQSHPQWSSLPILVALFIEMPSCDK